MATGDKVVTLDGLKAVFDYQEAEVSDLKSSTAHLVDPALAGYHNSIYRGKNITSYLTDGSLWKRLTGTGGYALFEDLYLGDYITVGSNSYEIADFDYYIRCGYSTAYNADIQKHHVVMIPKAGMVIPEGTVLYGSTDTLQFINTANAGVTVSSQETQNYFKWNATMEAPNDHTTNGGYKYSRMRTVIMKAADTIVANAFGAAHLQKVAVMYPNPASESASAFAGWAWFGIDDWSDPNRVSICDLMNETQVYGQQVWGVWNTYNGFGYEVGVDKFQLALFAKHRNSADIRAAWWLRSVNSATSAAVVSSDGLAVYSGSANALAVRPRFLLVG